MNIYVVGSLRNRHIIDVANTLREAGHEVYDDWIAPGEHTDSKWQAYEKKRNRTYIEALNGWHARHVFDNDIQHLNEADAVVLVMPAGKSAFWELGWATAAGKQTYMLIEKEPERFDIMVCDCDAYFGSVEDLVAYLAGLPTVDTDGKIATER